MLILGATGVGKTELALRVAERIGSPIVSCDSRQIFQEIPVGTAAPTADEQARVKHYFVGTRSVRDEYSAGQYEREAIALLEKLFATHDIIVMTGGSMLYADAVCKGLDELPTIPDAIRSEVQQQYHERGLEWLQHEVEQIDPDYWEIVDRSNPARLIHCIEICRATGGTYSSLRTNRVKERPFRIVKIGLERDRDALYNRINRRVEQMMAHGLLEEAKAVYPLRALTSLQTVGYRELFGYLDGEYGLDRAVALIQQNTRHYAKRQMTWFRRDNEIYWLDANTDYETNIHIINRLLSDSGVQEE